MMDCNDLLGTMEAGHQTCQIVDAKLEEHPILPLAGDYPFLNAERDVLRCRLISAVFIANRPTGSSC
jgi:hypothetical protein